LVNASAIGSLTLILSPYFLPAGSGDAGDLAHRGILAEAKTAHAEIAHIGTGAATQLAAVILSDFELGSSLLLDDK